MFLQTGKASAVRFQLPCGRPCEEILPIICRGGYYPPAKNKNRSPRPTPSSLNKAFSLEILRCAKAPLKNDAERKRRREGSRGAYNIDRL